MQVENYFFSLRAFCSLLRVSCPNGGCRRYGEREKREGEWKAQSPSFPSRFALRRMGEGKDAAATAALWHIHFPPLSDGDGGGGEMISVYCVLRSFRRNGRRGRLITQLLESTSSRMKRKGRGRCAMPGEKESVGGNWEWGSAEIGLGEENKQSSVAD